MEPTQEQLEKMNAQVDALEEALFNAIKLHEPSPSPPICCAALAALFKHASEAGGMDRIAFASLCQTLVSMYNEDEVELSE